MKTATSNSDTSLRLIIIYLLLSYFAALIFSMLAFRSRNRGSSGIGWIFLSIIFIGFFGFLSWGYVKYSSPSKDAFWYYLGCSTLIANSLALLINIINLIKKR